MLFEDDNTVSDYHLVGGPFHGQTSRVVIKEQDAWIWHCGESNVRKPRSCIQHNITGEKRPRENITRSRGALEALEAVKRRKHKS